MVLCSVNLAQVKFSEITQRDRFIPESVCTKTFLDVIITSYYWTASAQFLLPYCHLYFIAAVIEQ